LKNYVGAVFELGFNWFFGEIDVLKIQDYWGDQDTAAIVTGRVDKDV
jgi:hypothetical protein